MDYVSTEVTRKRFTLDRKPSGLAVWALFALFAVTTARSHTANTSYCKVNIHPDEVAISFTFDFATLRLMTQLDNDGDGRVTPLELGSATPAIESFLRRTVFLELNEREAVFGPVSPPIWSQDAGEAVVAKDYDQRLATFTFRNPTLHAPDAVALTFEFFEALPERHTVLGNFAWQGQDNPVIFTRFEPDYLFDTGYRVPASEQFGQYLWLGMTHIFLGYDHVAFLLALLFVPSFRGLVKVITAFSVAHTVTLGLAALGVVALPSKWVETTIAASIVYVAAQNLRHRGEIQHRWRITFAFGLVHGFGFATVLRELGLPANGLVRSLLAFNLGVEVGQLAIAAACWPLLVWIGRRRWAGGVRVAVSSVLITFGLAWLVDRAFEVDFMSKVGL